MTIIFNYFIIFAPASRLWYPYLAADAKLKLPNRSKRLLEENSVTFWTKGWFVNGGSWQIRAFIGVAALIPLVYVSLWAHWRPSLVPTSIWMTSALGNCLSPRADISLWSYRFVIKSYFQPKTGLNILGVEKMWGNLDTSIYLFSFNIPWLI